MLYATHAKVMLGNICRNIEGIRAHVGAEHPVLLAVKANSYGHGAVEVSRMAQETGCAQWLGVATVPEGLELREAGITLPILKLSGLIAEDEAEAAVRGGLTCAVPSMTCAELVEAAAQRVGLPAHVQLKVDTGMRRIGEFDESSIVALAQFCEDSTHLVLDGMFSHMPVSDAPAHDDFTQGQIARFARDVAEVEAALGRELDLVHIANSGGVLGQPAALLPDRDPSKVMVRPGIMMYGYYPDATTPHTVELHPGIEFATQVSFIKQVREGETVGYGRTWTAPRDTYIATLPVGYADGFSRLNSNRGRVLINGVSYPIAGRVCMDQCMVDLGPDSAVAVGDDAVLIGRQGEEEITCDEVAELMGTITYEVTCLLTPRVTRHYTSE